MRTTALTFLIMIQSLLMNAQFNTMFNDTINNFENLHNEFDVICKDDSFFYILGATYNFDFTWNTNISMFNEDGDKLLSNYIYDTFTNTASNPYNSMVINNDVILACFQTYDTITFGKIIAFDKHSLDTLWSKTYTHPDTLAASQPGADVFSDLTSIKPIPGGGYIVTGNYNKNCITGNMRSFLMKIDSLGNVLWRKTYDDVTQLYCVEISTDGSLYLLNPFGSNTNHLRKTDSQGNTQWEIVINSGLTGWANVHALTFCADNSIVGVGTYMYNSDIYNPLMGVNVFKVNPITKQVIWDNNYRVYYNVQCLSLHQAIGVEALPNGDIIVSGTTKNNGYAGFILKLNTNGDSLWCKSYSYGPTGNRDCQLNDLLLCDDGGFMGVGYYAPHNSNMTAWLFKTDANGVVGWDEHPKPESTYKAMIYPNPAINFVTLKYDCRYANMNYNITDMSGKALLAGELKTIANSESNEELLDLGSLSPGSYTLEVRAKGLALWSQKLVINK